MWSPSIFRERAGGETPPLQRIISPVGEGSPLPKYHLFHRYCGRYAASGVNRPYDNPSVTLRVPPPFTQGRLWVGCNHTATNNPCRDRRPDCPKYHSFYRYRGRLIVSPTDNNPAACTIVRGLLTFSAYFMVCCVPLD